MIGIMLTRQLHPALYASFDRYPSSKGAAQRIRRIARFLFDTAGGGLLYVLGNEDLPRYQSEGAIEILRYVPESPNILERTVQYSRALHRVLERQADSLGLCHFRDPWSGAPIVSLPGRKYATVYEVNGLPSIEMPATYPLLGPATLRKIRALEELCWTEADAIITPSEVIRANLIGLGVPGHKITVVPNGADIPEAPQPHPEAPESYVMYFGALQPWQGVDVLIRAFALLADFPSLHLVICSSQPHRHARPYQKLAEKLGVAPRLAWRFCLPQEELVSWITGAMASVAPLTQCSRNLEQGCCPLKIVESMACGVPVVASDIPSASELIKDGVSGKLVRPGRPSDLAIALRVLIEYPEEARKMGETARLEISNHRRWQHSLDRLAGVYTSLRRLDHEGFRCLPAVSKALS
jgi:glycosyltransferase involved in cell wall biosynthesis